MFYSCFIAYCTLLITVHIRLLYVLQQISGCIDDAIQKKVHTKKLKPGLVAFYDLRPGNRAGPGAKTGPMKVINRPVGLS